jgi:hypothetical protein
MHRGVPVRISGSRSLDRPRQGTTWLPEGLSQPESTGTQRRSSLWSSALPNSPATRANGQQLRSNCKGTQRS